MRLLDAKWAASMAAWHDNEAAGCRRANGPSSHELADMHETTALMLRAAHAEIARLRAEVAAAQAWRDAEKEASELHGAYMAVFGRRGEETAHPAWKAACRRVDVARAAYDAAREAADLR